MTTPDPKPVVTPATPQQIRAAVLIDKLWNDKIHGSAVRKLAKEEFPDITLPEDTLAPLFEAQTEREKVLEERLTKLQEEHDKDRTERREAGEFAALSAKVDSAVDKYGLTADGKEKMLSRMKETGNVSDPEASAAWVAQSTPPAPKPGPTYGDAPANFFGSQKQDEAFAALHRDPQRYLDEQLTEFTQDPDKYVRETFGQ